MKDEMSTDELGALFGCSAETIRSMTRRHVLTKVGKAYPVAESVRRAIASLRSTASAAGRPMASGVAEMRARKLKLECDAMEREERAARGELMVAADLERDLTKRFREFRDGMLQFPSSVSWLDRELHRRLLERIRELLSDFADGRPYLKVDETKGNGAQESGHDQL
jgi:hypothetical protein